MDSSSSQNTTVSHPHREGLPKMFDSPTGKEAQEKQIGQVERAFTNARPKISEGTFSYLTPEYRRDRARSDFDTYVAALDSVIQNEPDSNNAALAEIAKEDLNKHFNRQLKDINDALKNTKRAEADRELVVDDITQPTPGKIRETRFFGKEIKRKEIQEVIEKSISEVVSSDPEDTPDIMDAARKKFLDNLEAQVLAREPEDRNEGRFKAEPSDSEKLKLEIQARQDNLQKRFERINKKITDETPGLNAFSTTLISDARTKTEKLFTELLSAADTEKEGLLNQLDVFLETYNNLVTRALSKEESPDKSERKVNPPTVTKLTPRVFVEQIIDKDFRVGDKYALARDEDTTLSNPSGWEIINIQDRMVTLRQVLGDDVGKEISMTKGRLGARLRELRSMYRGLQIKEPQERGTPPVSRPAAGPQNRLVSKRPATPELMSEEKAQEIINDPLIKAVLAKILSSEENQTITEEILRSAGLSVPRKIRDTLEALKKLGILEDTTYA